MLLEPTLFRGYIALSPSVWWNGGALLQSGPQHTPALSGLGRVVFVASANEEQIVEGTARLAALLKAQGGAGMALFYDPRLDPAHDTIFLALAPAAFTEVLGTSYFRHE